MRIKRTTLSIGILLICLSMFLGACNSSDSTSSDDSTTSTTETTDATTSEDDITRPEGWTAETHGDDASANYEVVFKDDEVGRIDLTITASDWEAMMTDENLVAAYGSFGSQSAIGMPPADEMEPDDVVEPVGGMAPPGGMPPPGGINEEAVELTENPIWIPCTLTFTGITWNYVGVRLKGNSSLRDAWTAGIYKMPFRFDFDEFEDIYTEIDDQRFYGFKKLTLSSGYKDDSLIREKIVADIFRGLGVPAPRTAFYRLFIDCSDGEGARYFGLYTMVEVPTDPMLEAQFWTSDGNLYKPDGATASFGAGSLSEEDFDKETNKDEADYSDVNALYTAINDTTSDDETWKSTLESIFDVDSFLNWLAVNTVIQNWDTYGNMTHNYYLYNDDGMLTWIPWDNNEALKDTDAAIQNPLSLELDEGSLDVWPLISRVLEQTEYKNIYQQYCETTVTDYFNTENMQVLYEDAHNLICNYVVGDEGEQEGYTLLNSSQDFINSLDYLNTHVENRESAVTNFLNL
ncbi:CotH kinase family protein [Desulfobacula phenolica]|uniref:CotH protein n=1 Tax=Desulfobacula phenolica TaxID=90732 RepID=A0A1H2IQ93_9BACT|nr:CotH kinase family protein [Desulfobacula phenolica]SDU46191.1 CotH protein [Desulfobacula phenolica]